MSEDLKDEFARLRLEVDRLKKSVDEIKPHRHCLNCGIAIPPDKTFCSKKCEAEWNAMLRRKKMSIYVWMILLLILIIIMFVAMGGK